MIQKWMRGYQQVILHGLLIVLPAVLLYVHGRDRGRESAVADALTAITAPGQQAMDAVVRGVSGFFGRYLLLMDTEEENEGLRTKSRALAIRLTLLERRVQTAERQARMCGFRFAREDLRLTPARVVAFDLGPLSQALRLAVELPEGAEALPVDASVITPRGLVGRVVRQSGRFAEVELASDTRSRIHARAGDPGALGTVKGAGASDRFGLRFVTNEANAKLKAGDPVVTSGHDRRFVPGLVIGVIASDEARQEGIDVEYAVKPAVPFWQVREVFVVLGQAMEEGP